MTTSIKIFIITSLLWCTAFASPKPPNLSGVYNGFWATTHWQYQFWEDGNFLFKSLGHFGNTYSYGIYTISNDTLTISTFDDWEVDIALVDTTIHDFLRFNHNQFIIDGDSCIIDMNIRYDYCKDAQDSSIKLPNPYMLHHNSRKR